VPDDVPLEAPPRPVTDHAWTRRSYLWDVYFVVVLAMTVMIVLADDQAPARNRVIAMAGLLAMAPLWALVGRPALTGCENSRRALCYFAGLIVLLGIAQQCSGASSLILFALCTQCYMLLSLRMALLALIALNITPFASLLAANRGHPAAVLTILGVAVMAVACSAMLGTWIERIMDQSVDRAELIEQLETTRAELAEVSREAGGLAERQRLAGEIHDTLAQGFTSILMLLQAAEAQLDPGQVQVRRQLDLAARTARENLAESRALIAALGPVDLGASTLEEALKRLTGRLAEELGITVECAVLRGSESLESRSEVVLLRCAQESLANVRKHAAASVVKVSLTYEPDRVRLVVTDDGRGFAPEEARGFGLHGMRDRVGQVGGTLDVCSTPGTGTVVAVEVPA
jgi:signal transduction histidine kinase